MIGSVKPLPFRPVFPTCGFMLAHGPPAVQLVAPVDDQVSVERPPDTTVVGEAVRVAVGARVVQVPLTHVCPATHTVPHDEP